MRIKVKRQKKGLGGILTAKQSGHAELDRINAATINEGLNTIAEKSLQQVPQYTGALAGSLFIDNATEDNLEGRVGYGFENAVINPISGISTAKYAWAVHENLDMPHVNGKAKFLEDPVNEERPKIKARVRLNAKWYLKNLG